MSHAGKIIQRIRYDKHFTQGALSKGIIDPATLSKYERGLIHITDDYLFQMLFRMNVCFSEFGQLYLHQNDIPIQQEFLGKLSKAVEKKDARLLLQLEEEEIELQQNGNIRHQHNQQLLQLHLQQLRHQPIQTKITRNLIQYLSEIDTWGTYEISLFDQLIPFLHTKEYKRLLTNSYDKSHLFLHHELYTHQMSRIFLKAYIQSIVQEDFDFAYEIATMIQDILEGKNLLYTKCQLKFYSGILEIATGKTEKGEKQCQQVIEALYLLDEDILARENQKVLEDYMKLKKLL